MSIAENSPTDTNAPSELLGPEVSLLSVITLLYKNDHCRQYFCFRIVGMPGKHFYSFLPTTNHSPFVGIAGVGKSALCARILSDEHYGAWNEDRMKLKEGKSNTSRITH